MFPKELKNELAKAIKETIIGKVRRRKVLSESVVNTMVGFISNEVTYEQLLNIAFNDNYPSIVLESEIIEEGVWSSVGSGLGKLYNWMGPGVGTVTNVGSKLIKPVAGTAGTVAQSVGSGLMHAVPEIAKGTIASVGGAVKNIGGAAYNFAEPAISSVGNVFRGTASAAKTPSLAIASIVGIASIARLIYNRFFSSAAKQCEGVPNKGECIREVKARAATEAMKSLQQQKSKCKNSKNPQACSWKIDKLINSYKSSISYTSPF